MMRFQNKYFVGSTCSTWKLEKQVLVNNVIAFQ